MVSDYDGSQLFRVYYESIWILSIYILLSGLTEIIRGKEPITWRVVKISRFAQLYTITGKMLLVTP